jgi:hypothetical protein
MEMSRLFDHENNINSYDHTLRLLWNKAPGNYPFIFDLCPSDIHIYHCDIISNIDPNNMTTTTTAQAAPHIHTITQLLEEYISDDIIKLSEIIKRISDDKTAWRSLKMNVPKCVDYTYTRYFECMDKYFQGYTKDQIDDTPLVGLTNPSIQQISTLSEVASLLFTKCVYFFNVNSH